MFLIGPTLNAATLGQFIYAHGDRINHKNFWPDAQAFAGRLWKFGTCEVITFLCIGMISGEKGFWVLKMDEGTRCV